MRVPPPHSLWCLKPLFSSLIKMFNCFIILCILIKYQNQVVCEELALNDIFVLRFSCFFFPYIKESHEEESKFRQSNDQYIRKLVCHLLDIYSWHFVSLINTKLEQCAGKLWGQKKVWLYENFFIFSLCRTYLTVKVHRSEIDDF